MTLGGLGLVLLLVFSSQSVSNRLWWYLESSAQETFDPTATYDAVVLLGGVVTHGWAPVGQPPAYNDNVERLLVTYDLLRQNHAKVAIISGGIPDRHQHPNFEAVVLAQQLADWGIAKDRLIVEDHALNTRDNAVETARLVRSRNDHRIVVVTSAFHMNRAAGCFRAVELPIDTLPVDRRAVDPAATAEGLLPGAGELAVSTSAIHELFGRLVYRLQGYSR